MWSSGSLTQRPKEPFAVLWSKQLDKKDVIAITTLQLASDYRQPTCSRAECLANPLAARKTAIRATIATMIKKWLIQLFLLPNLF